MKNLKFSFSLLVLLFAWQASAYVVGVSSHPFQLKRDIFNTEYNTLLSDDGGKGIQVRYMRRVTSKITMEGGVGVNDGTRESRFFAAADYLLYPEYQRQPRISMKGFVSTAKEFGNRLNNVGVAPIVSKGFLFWGQEAYPFISLPTQISLDTDTNTYQTQTSLALGITGALPVKGYEHITANLESNINLRNNYTAMVIGISMPLK